MLSGPVVSTVLAVTHPATPDPRLAVALRDVRRQRGLSQETTAHAAGITVSAYARIERGEVNPTWTTVTQIAKALDISLASLGEAVEAGHQSQ